MELAVAQARQCVGEPGKVSPKVGAVVMQDGQLLGQAYRGEVEPGEHAEYTLLERKLADAKLAGTTLFTTLEPCTHRNPPKVPCVERIIERKISRVFIGTVDPNDLIRGGGQLRLRQANVEILFFDPDLMAELEELNRDFTRSQASGHIVRTAAQTADPATGEIGPNGDRVGYNDDGDKVEFLPDEDAPGGEWQMVLRRNDAAILASYNEFWDKVWWKRHKELMQTYQFGVNPTSDGHVRKGMEGAARIEGTYGLEALEAMTDYDWVLLEGQMGALSWVLGTDWDQGVYDT